MNRKSQVIKTIGLGLLWLAQYSMAQTIGSTTINQSAQNISSMSVQSFKSYSVDFAGEGRNIETPICVIGDDAFSKQWLHAYKEHLVDLQAFCLVTNVDSEKALQELQQIAPKINMSIADVSWIPLFLGVKHYPALIMQNEVIQ